MTNIDRICATCPPDIVLPIVFVPGIMGSRLKQSAADENVWDPVSRRFLGQYAGSSPARRRELLIGGTGSYFDPDFLTVDYSNAASMADHVPADRAQDKVDRGWGGLVWEFYGPFLLWLENHLPGMLAADDPQLSGLKIEAYAEPYNWAGDNGASAAGLNRRVEQAIAETRHRHQAQSRHLLSPIVITHSMGGLVGRSFAKSQPAAANVAAIIHGAMPTHGAPAAYKRFMAGFEGAASLALGITGSQVVAIGANSPGVLQLMPNQFHQDQHGDRQWMKLMIEDQVCHALPLVDPYTEIYAREDVWWRPVHADEIDPENPDPLAQELAWTSYLDNPDISRSFHATLGEGASGFHPNTYMLYAESTATPAWDRIEWRATTPERTDLGVSEEWSIWGVPTGIHVRSARTTEDPALRAALERALRSAPEQRAWEIMPGAGHPLGAILDLGSLDGADGTGIRLEGRAVLQKGTAAGDGTVHAGSGIKVPSIIESEPTRDGGGGLVGYAHDQCYNDVWVRHQVASWLKDEILKGIH